MSGITGASGVSDSIEVKQISHGSGMAGTVMSQSELVRIDVEDDSQNENNETAEFGIEGDVPNRLSINSQGHPSSGKNQN